MKGNGRNITEDRENNSEKPKLILQFVCPECGCRDLRVMEQARHYPIAILDDLAVNAETVKFEELRKREEGPYWLVDDPKEEWECWCVECEFVPDLEQYDEEKTKEDKLVRWLLDNCPQTDDGDRTWAALQKCSHASPIQDVQDETTVNVSAVTLSDLEEMEFQCPFCGGDTLALFERIYQKAALSPEGHLDTWGDERVHEQEREFGCWICEFRIEDENGPIWEIKSVIKWLMENCRQNRRIN